MRQVRRLTLWILGASLMGSFACAEQPGKKKEEPPPPAEDDDDKDDKKADGKANAAKPVEGKPVDAKPAGDAKPPE